MTSTTASERRIAVVGLGYVGLPVAVAMARRFPHTIGFDIDEAKVERLRRGVDITGEVEREALEASGLRMTADPADLAAADFFIVAVPTPIDDAKSPDLGPVRAASRTVGAALNKGDVVVYESTVYPGVTRDVCGPILEEVSGLVCGEDFKLAYSPERINPGDKEHTFERIVKVVSGQDEPTLDLVADVYGSVVDAGVHRAASLEVAEASKVIENIQRDLNIAFMNELSIIFDRLGIHTWDVLKAAGTKWNFRRFHPGLVGGHCIGVDPYYLTTRAAQVGITPQVILAGRRINDGMGAFVAQRTIKQLILAGRPIHGARVGVLGLTFKENVPDLRNSRVPDIIGELEDYGVEVVVHDPMAPPDEARHEYGLELRAIDQLGQLDAVVYAVPHRGLDEAARELGRSVAVFVDVRARFDAATFPEARYWRL